MASFQKEGSNSAAHGMSEDQPWFRKIRKQRAADDIQIVHIIIKVIHMCYGRV